MRVKKILSLFHPLLFALAIGCLTTATHAQSSDDDTLDLARQHIESVQKSLRANDTDADLLKLRGNVLEARAQAEEIETRLKPQLDSVQARLTELSTPGAAPAKNDGSDIGVLRNQLEKNRNALDAQTKLARVLIVEADQTTEQIATMRRSEFKARLGERTESILARPFWSELHDNATHDFGRLAVLGRVITDSMYAVSPWVWLITLLCIAGLIALRIWAGQLFLQWISMRVPTGRLRRSVHALTIVLLTLATPGLVALILQYALEWNGALSTVADDLLETCVELIFFGGYLTGIGRALLSPDKPTWRLLPVPDLVASKMRNFPLVMAIVIVIGWLAEKLATIVNASLATTVALNCIVAIALGLTMALALMRSEQLRRRALHDPTQGASPPRPLWLGIFAGLAWLALALSLVGLLFGYVALGSFVVKQVVWITVLLASAYLLNVLIDDLCMTLLASAKESEAKPEDQQESKSKVAAITFTPKMRDQAAVLVSGIARLLVLLIALMLIVAPFGEGPTELLHRTWRLSDGLMIGKLELRPLAVVQALAVLALGLIGVRVLKRWLTEDYFPTTHLDPSMRMSATMLFGYAAVVLVVAFALSALGIGLERIAWIASALSVGIGFGLQAIVQNFVSGLILLAERPVKVGDWVSLGPVEGDIRRINVRATEIEMGDRSTVIVPNSEFITKTVRNVTHANPLGLVQIKLPMPLDTRVEDVRALMLASFQAHDAIQETPAPDVALDGIEQGNLIFNATGFVASPRLTYGVRSNLLFDIIRRLREANLNMSKQPTVLINASKPGDSMHPEIPSDLPRDGTPEVGPKLA